MADLKLDDSQRKVITDASTQPICTCRHLLVEHVDGGGECHADGCSCPMFREDQRI